MTALQHQTLVERIHERLSAMLAGGELAPGSRLDERALADALRVSRTPLREAIGRLTKEGLVEHRPYRGAFVRTLSATEVGEIYEVRRVLEGLAVRLAVPRLTDADIEEVHAALEATERTLAEGDLVGYAAADQRFHELFIRVAGNGTLSETLARLRLQIQSIRLVANRDPGIVARTAIERPRIVAALEARDAGTAARLMEEHIVGVGRSYHDVPAITGERPGATPDEADAAARVAS